MTHPEIASRHRPRSAHDRHKTGITGIRTVSVSVDDQDAALHFYNDALGFSLLRDDATPDGGRWIELAPGADHVIVTLEPATPNVTRGPISVRFTTAADAAHTALHDAGVDTDDILRWPACRRCSPSATPTATRSPSPKPPDQPAKGVRSCEGEGANAEAECLHARVA